MEPTETRTCTNMLSRELHCIEWLLLEIALHLEHHEVPDRFRVVNRFVEFKRSLEHPTSS